ncbi:MAG: hypothetical protein ACN4GT_09945 [Gammaproteobacteria bacterium]
MAASKRVRTGQILFLVLISTVIAVVAGCGGGSGTPASPAFVALSYNGPGSVWDVDLLDGEFVITKRESLADPVDLTVNGTYSDLVSGFKLLTVTSSAGVDGPVAGELAWALEIPGYAFFLKPMGSDSGQIISMVTAGECPTADFDANWVIVKKSHADDATEVDGDYFGTFAFDSASGVASLPGRYALAANFADQGPDTLTGGNCANGLMEVDDAVMYLTTNGGALVHTNVSNDDESSIIFALPQKSIASMASLDGEYAGILFDGSMASGEEVAPLSFSCTNGICMGALISDVVTGQIEIGDTATVDLSGSLNAPATGLITGTVNGDGVGNLACAVDTNALSTGRKIISCVGQSPGDQTKMFNVIMVSKDT